LSICTYFTYVVAEGDDLPPGVGVDPDPELDPVVGRVPDREQVRLAAVVEVEVLVRADHRVGAGHLRQ
jgi:hypothetical protein